MPSLGEAEIRYTYDSKQGGRKYMEDVIHIHFEQKDGKIEYAFFAVYDGHGGPNASQFAKEHLLSEITKQRNFWSNDDTQVLKAIKDGFISCHRLMWKAVDSWPKTLSGLPSTSGTTASVVFIRNGKVFCAHVGDSGVVLGVKAKKGNRLGAHCITVDHKPESPKELKRIKACGGNVVAKAGVNRVVWDRPKQHHGPVLRSTEVDHIPFLAVARALGDLWSYNSNQDVFVVSPEPDVCVFDLDVSRHKCFVLASDGLWNMVRPQETIDYVQRIEQENEKLEDDVLSLRSGSALVKCALDRWMGRGLRADNTSVIVVMIDPVGSNRERSPSVASTVSISSTGTRLLSESEDEEVSSSESESELSDSDLIDSFAPDIDMDEENSDNTELDVSGGVSLPCFGGVGLMRTPPCGLSNGGLKPKLRRLGSLKRLDSKTTIVTKVTPRKPIFRARSHILGSAPAKMVGHSSHFRGICKNSPFSRSRLTNRVIDASLQQQQQQQQQQPKNQGSISQAGSNASFMDPGFKCPVVVHVVKGTGESGIPNGGGASPVLPTVPAAGERTLRPKSPRLIGENLLPVAAGSTSCECVHVSPCSGHAQKDTSPSANGTPTVGSLIPTDIVPSSPIATLNFVEPKEATSPRSPLKIDTLKGSPSAGLVSPLWPSSLEIGLEVDFALNGENLVPVATNSGVGGSGGGGGGGGGGATGNNSGADNIDDESTENIAHPKSNTPGKKFAGHKRKPGSPIPPRFGTKRLKSNTPQKVVNVISPQKYSQTIRTRGQLKSLSPHKNTTSPRMNITPRKTSS